MPLVLQSHCCHWGVRACGVPGIPRRCPQCMSRVPAPPGEGHTGTLPFSLPDLLQCRGGGWPWKEDEEQDTKAGRCGWEGRGPWKDPPGLRHNLVPWPAPQDTTFRRALQGGSWAPCSHVHPVSTAHVSRRHGSGCGSAPPLQGDPHGTSWPKAVLESLNGHQLVFAHRREAGRDNGGRHHLDERGCRRDLPVEVLLSLLLLDLQGKAGAENPLGRSRNQGLCPHGQPPPGLGDRMGAGGTGWVPGRRLGQKVAPCERVCGCAPGIANGMDVSSFSGRELSIRRGDQSYTYADTHTRAHPAYTYMTHT